MGVSMQGKTIDDFFTLVEDMVQTIFRESGSWNPMAVAWTPSGLKMISVPEGRNDKDAAGFLRRELKTARAQAYGVAYLTVKQSSSGADEALSRGDEKLDEVLTEATDGALALGPDQVLFIFMSDRSDERVRAYGVGRGWELAGRLGWLEKSSSPLHRLLQD